MSKALTERKKVLLARPEKVIVKFGYEYVLVECDRIGYINPCAFGFSGYALKKIRKLKKEKDGRK